MKVYIITGRMKGCYECNDVYRIEGVFANEADADRKINDLEKLSDNELTKKHYLHKPYFEIEEHEVKE